MTPFTVNWPTVLRAFGPPLIVPGGPSGRGWKLSGLRGSPDAPASIDASVRGRGQRLLEVETLAEEDRTPFWFRVRRAVEDAVPYDVGLPLTLVATGRDIEVPVSGRGAARLEVVQCGRSWVAWGRVSGRFVGIRGVNSPIGQVRLRAIDDLDALDVARRTRL